MGTIEISADTLARVYDMAEQSHENTKEALAEEELSDGAKHMLDALAAKQEASLDIVEQKLENDPDVEVEP